MTAIGDSKTPVFVDNNGDAKPCTKKLHSITVQDLGDADGPLLANIKIGDTTYTIHDKKA